MRNNMNAVQNASGEMTELAEGARLKSCIRQKAYLGFESPSLRQNYPGGTFMVTPFLYSRL